MSIIYDYRIEKKEKGVVCIKPDAGTWLSCELPLAYRSSESLEEYMDRRLAPFRFNAEERLLVKNTIGARISNINERKNDDLS